MELEPVPSAAASAPIPKAVVASALRGGRFHHTRQPVLEEMAEGAAETALLADEQVTVAGTESAPFVQDKGFKSFPNCH